MLKKTAIVVINNTYHSEMFKSLNWISGDALVYCDSNVATDIQCDKIDIPEIISLKRGIFTRLSAVKRVRNMILNQTKGLHVYSIIMGSDKELFNQLLMSIYPNAKVSLFDEGIGYYRSVQKWSRLRNLIYKLLSKCLLGVKIEYVQPLGSHRLVNEIYIRRYDLLSFIREDVRYKYLHVTSSKGPCMEFNNSILLLLPWDLNDKRYVLKVVKTISIILKNCKENIELKPHPSDNHDWSTLLFESDDHRVKVLRREVRAESLCFDSYRYVINFRSSSILDYLFNGGGAYIFTVSLDHRHVEDNIYPNMVHYMNEDRIREYINLGNQKYHEFVQRRKSDLY